jgi:cupin fold WbuC family metalloprotein
LTGLRADRADVLQAEGAVVALAGSDVAELYGRAAGAKLGRARIRMHPDTDDPLHEMLIALTRSSYVRPHKHPGKSESFHVVAGRLDVVLFDDEGRIEEIVRMGDHGSGLAFYYRLNRPMFHTVVVRSDEALVHEVTNGPFRSADTVYAPWGPDDGDDVAKLRLAARIDTALEGPQR